MGLVVSVFMSGLLVPNYADTQNPYQEQITKGRNFLLTKLKNEKGVGYLGLGVMALIKTAPYHVSAQTKGRRTKSLNFKK